MSRAGRFAYDTLPVSRWRNGGGETREIISWPPAEQAAGEFGWRASIATLDRDGDFSAFPGIDRIITLLEGRGVELHNGRGATHALVNPGRPYAFAGEDAVSATLLGGPSRDFNIMTRRGDYLAGMTRIAGEQILPAGNSGVVYVLAGQWLIDGDAPLEARQGIWWHDRARPLRLQPADARGIALWADIRGPMRAGGA
ncbi:HutD family protein [Sodalis sp. RH21]|uniref:HutD/Ves family protein n=1 Tax=unclassified Sodalis (in: enterobacteria) TaxID=2636512 RepID=UPI0039B40760